MISTIQTFAMEDDRVQYLKSVNAAFSQTKDLLRDGTRLKQRCKEMEVTKRSRATPIVEDIHEYLHLAINMSLQGIRNCAVRSHYLSKVRTKFNALAQEVERKDVAALLELEEYAETCKDAMKKYYNYRSAGGRAWTEAYRTIIKEKGQTIADLVKSHQNKLGFEGEFESLEEMEQLKVYNSIIEEACELSFGFVDKLALVGGPAVFLATAGLMVYDILNADDHTEAALHNGLDAINMIEGFAVQVVVEKEATKFLADYLTGDLVLSLGALVLGCAAGLIFCAAAGLLIDEVIGSGGAKAPKLEGLNFHKITAPPDEGQSPTKLPVVVIKHTQKIKRCANQILSLAHRK